MITLYDQQTGKEVTGYPKKVTRYQFTLINEGEVVGIFSTDNLPKDYVPFIDETSPLQAEGKDKDEPARKDVIHHKETG